MTWNEERVSQTLKRLHVGAEGATAFFTILEHYSRTMRDRAMFDGAVLYLSNRAPWIRLFETSAVSPGGVAFVARRMWGRRRV